MRADIIIPMGDRLHALRAVLDRHGQAHVLALYDTWSASQQHALLDQVAALDFDELDALIDRYVRPKPAPEVSPTIEPAAYYAHDPGRRAESERFREAGWRLIEAGKVAAFTVAGGQGTRLGWDGPKGAYPATPVTAKPLFQVFAEQLLSHQRRRGAVVPWYIMTSPGNDAQTRALFRDHDHFGLNPRDVRFFPQGVLPSMEMGTGRLLLDAPGVLAMNPDGHGGSIKALRASGAIDDMRARGVMHISYFQVDNPLVNIVDPIFIGLHAAAPDSSGEMSSKMVLKTDPREKVGVFCRMGGKTTVLEYSDLPQHLADEREPDGRLRFRAASIAIHLISVRFVERLTADARHFALPYHRAEKKVPFIDPQTGRRVEPAHPNAVKLETFVFDALPLAESSIVYETLREEEFAPIKNADGADSPTTSRQMQCDRAARWLEQVGVLVPRDPQGHAAARIEISPLTALEPGDLKALPLPTSLAPGQQLVL